MILVLSDLWVPFPGGAERLMFNLARDLMRRGEDVHVLTGYHPAQQFDGPAFDVLEIPENATGGRRLRDAIRDASPDVVITHHYWALSFEVVISNAARDVAAPIVQVVLNGRRIVFASHAVYISNFVREATDRGATPPVTRSRPNDQVIYPLAFPDVVAPTHADAIGFIKPIHHKGVDLFYAIAEAMPDRRFVVLRGEWQDIEVIRELPNVEFMEPVADIRDFYSRVRMVLVPSLSEDAGTIAQECTLNEIVCMSSNVGGLQETNAGGLRVINNDNLLSWVHSINTIMDDSDVYRAIVTAMQRLNPTTQTDELDVFAERIRKLQGR